MEFRKGHGEMRRFGLIVARAVAVAAVATLGRAATPLEMVALSGSLKTKMQLTRPPEAGLLRHGRSWQSPKLASGKPNTRQAPAAVDRGSEHGAVPHCHN
jgi:hypothetical protein